MKRSGYSLLTEFTLKNNKYEYSKKNTDEYSYYRMTSDYTKPDGTPMCFRIISDKTGRLMLWYCLSYSYDADDPELYKEVNRLNSKMRFVKFVSEPNIDEKYCHIEASYIYQLSYSSYELTDPGKMALASIYLDLLLVSFMTECYNAEIMMNINDDEAEST